MEMVKID